MIALFSITLFLSAWLLFWLQLLFAKMVLPLLGGSPAVWNTCLVFFQVVLLLGYSVAHRIRRWPLGWQLLGLGTVMGLAGLLFPIRLPAPEDWSWVIPFQWSQGVQEEPVFRLLIMLTVGVGLPFGAVSTLAPLLQSWFSQSLHKARRDPYFFYVASNAGSLWGVLSFPLLLEPNLTLPQQSGLWRIGFGVLWVCVGICGFWAWIQRPPLLSDDLIQPNVPSSNAPSSRVGDPGLSSAETERITPLVPTGLDRAQWAILAFIPSSLLLGITAYLTTDVAAVPLLWAIPLALYLLTFMLAFAQRLPPSWIQAAFPLLALWVSGALLLNLVSPATLLLPSHLGVMTLAAWITHGELARRRPTAEHLTDFYFWVALGGAAGGVWNALLAPLVFDTVLEYPLTLLLAVLLIPEQKSPEQKSWLRLSTSLLLSFGILVPLLLAGWEWAGLRWSLVAGIAVWAGTAKILKWDAWRTLASGVLVFLLLNQAPLGLKDQTLSRQRSFFGVYRVVQEKTPTGEVRGLLHGTTLHGLQRLTQPQEPLTYFSQQGPAGQVLSVLQTPEPDALPPHRLKSARLRQVAVLGLGIGTLAAYAQPDQHWTFFEIDPLVETLARHYFTFLTGSLGHLDVVVGDGRLALKGVPDHSLNLMVMDAFSSDAVPVHLLTQEALQLYRQKLTAQGILLVNITNRYLNLEPVLAGLAEDMGWSAWIRWDERLSAADRVQRFSSSRWVVMAPSPADLPVIPSDPRWRVVASDPKVPLWTDRYSNVVRVFRVQS